MVAPLKMSKDNKSETYLAMPEYFHSKILPSIPIFKIRISYYVPGITHKKMSFILNTSYLILDT